ncbi:MAG: FadR family transcriptional regulator [Spirochaetales bacterium]|nr:FadR family transcriptional regulator [Spirochaetales bacterium]
MLKRTYITKEVKKYVEEYIIKNKLLPGSALPPEGEIASTLGVSRGSVREAVKALETLGIIEVKHGNGLFVREINFDVTLDVLSYNLYFDPSTLAELLQIRELLETRLVPEIINNIKQDDLEECKACLDEWKERIVKGLNFYELDMKFHLQLYRAVGNKILLELGRIFWIAYANAEKKYLPLKETSKEELFKSYEEHCKLLEAIEKRKPDIAGKLMYDHFRGIEKRLTRILKK